MNIPRWATIRKHGRPYHSVIAGWGGRITIWRGGRATEYRATLASYRRVRRLLVVSAVI